MSFWPRFAGGVNDKVRCVDTDVFSYSFKGDSRGRSFERSYSDRDPCVSFMTVGELYRWSIAHNWGVARHAALVQAISRCVVLRYDQETARIWASIAVARARIGRPIGCGDCWIAACAVRNELPLVTNNPSDYEHIDALKLLSSD